MFPVNHFCLRFCLSVRTFSCATDSCHPRNSPASSSSAVSSRILSINYCIWKRMSSRRAEWGFIPCQLQLPYCGTLSTRRDPEPESRSYAPTQPTSSATTLGRSYRQIPASRQTSSGRFLPRGRDRRFHSGLARNACSYLWRVISIVMLAITGILLLRDIAQQSAFIPR
jgi:drug/metabolite transporter superfamily protein YnfA